MGANKDFLKTLRAGRCSFYLADFHTHSPASFDIRSGQRFEQLSDADKASLQRIPESAASDPVRFEQLVISAIPPATYLEQIVNQRNLILGEVEPDAGLEWAIVSITDHNICGYSCAVADAAFTTRAENKLIVLPGIELDIIYPCPQTNVESQVHILCSFQPGTNPTNIQIAIRDASGNTWEPGQPATVKALPSFIHALRTHKEWPAICTAAHVSSGKGVQKETKFSILTHLDAELSRLEGEKQSGKNPDLRSIEAQVQDLERKREPDSIALEVLRLIGNCGFDALQVTSTADAVHYRRLHRFRDDHGRAATIVASDAHRVEDIFRAGEYFPHLKIPPLGSTASESKIFNDIRRALRYGETRFSACAQSPAQFWISGIQVIPDSPNASKFWPQSSPTPSTPKSYTLPLSRNLNTLIGGRGSGKSATIEAIAFISEAESFNEQAFKRNDRAEFYTRAEATLSGCRVKLCWQFSGGKLPAALPKRAIFAERYFDPQHKHSAVKYTNADDVQLVPQQLPPHAVQIFRLGEIEKQAGPDKLRLLFDKICGPQVDQIQAEIDETTLALKMQRSQLVAIADQARSLVEDGTPLREYAARKSLYDQVNTPELKTAYEDIDKLEAATGVLTRTIDDFNVDSTSEKMTSLERHFIQFFERARAIVVDGTGVIKPHLAPLAELVAAKSEGNGNVSEQNLLAAVSKVRKMADELSQKLTAVCSSVKESLLAAKNILSAMGLPSGSNDREAKRNALVEADTALTKYRDIMKAWEELIEKRRELRVRLSDLSNQRSAVRRSTAEAITKRLKADLDGRIIQIEADAQSGTDRQVLRNWLTTNFRGGEFKYQVERVRALVNSGLTPDSLRQLLMAEGSVTHDILKVHRDSAADGDIDEENAKRLKTKWQAVIRLPPEIDKLTAAEELWDALPNEVRAGLVWFPGEDKALALDQALLLDEIVFDDTPVIRLDDRPNDPKSKARPVEELSPGQRCSAVLPILLLTGELPLIIDQPEDNLDNRLIRQVIVNILASIKLRRQVIIATHNPNLPVLGDVEAAVVLQGTGDRQCEIVQTGDLDSADLSHHLTEVMEGGREAFQYRHTIYANHWTDSVSNRE